MKAIIDSINNIFKFRNKFSFKYFLPEISIIVLIAFLNLMAGCNYYAVRTVKNNNPSTNARLNETLKNNKKYVIVHLGSKALHLKDIKIDDDKQLISGFSEAVDEMHSHYYNPKKADNRYENRYGNPTYEVHIYVSKYSEGSNSEINIPYSEITKINVYDTDAALTVFSVLGVIVCVALVITIIIAATKSSCPFVYAYDGQNFHFTGEMYGGAIYSSLERDDYMPLPGIVIDSGKYQVKISNELLERQYTNLAELITVNHPDNTSVLVDKYGVVQTIINPVAPSLALSENNIDFSSTILARDSNSFMFNEENRNNAGLSSIILSFKKPQSADSGKLILNTKNSYWLDYVYGKFTEEFGTYYNTFAEKQKKVPPKKNIQWSLEQGIPLSVYVETNKGWEFADYVNVMGPLASRDIVVPVDLSKCGKDNVRIKLECGFMFWEIDYAAMDFTKNIPVDVKHLAPASAIDEKGNEVSALLSATDKKYLIQPEIGNAVIIDYSATEPGKNNKQTVFLHNRGYYEYIRDYKNKPNFLHLSSFKKKGTFTQFAKNKYYEFIDNKDVLANSLN